MHRVLRGLEWGFRQRTLRHLTPPVIRPHPLSSFKSFTTISQYSSTSSSLSSSSSSSSRQELPSCPPNLNEQHRRGGDPGECHILPPNVSFFGMFVLFVWANHIHGHILPLSTHIPNPLVCFYGTIITAGMIMIMKLRSRRCAQCP